jgi:hypothetical protein
VSQMMDPTMMGPPPDAGLPPEGPMGPPPMGPPPMGPPDGGLPPDLMAALSGGGMNSQDTLAEGPLAGEETALADEEAGGDDPLVLVRDAIALLRQAGDLDPDDQRSHLIDKVQADLQKILATESQKTDKLRSALGG